MRRKLLSLGLTFLMSSYLSISAQYMKDGYVSYGKDGNYGNVFRVSSYTNDDENFFISRVKPKARFTDKSTQVNQDFVNWWNWTDGTDAAKVSRKIAMWTPIGFGHSAKAAESPFMAMPNGIYNSEVFSMWQYISHWGLWSEYFMCMPGNFADVAIRMVSQYLHMCLQVGMVHFQQLMQLGAEQYIICLKTLQQRLPL